MQEITYSESYDVSRTRPGVLRLFRDSTLLEQLVFVVLASVFFVSTIAALWQTNEATLVAVPKNGGRHTEGIIGSPRFINPALATSDADRDLAKLVYAGLMTEGPDGTLVPELASGYTVSDDGKTYHFTLKENLVFHDGMPLTADDVVFSVEVMKNSAMKSPQFVHWEGVNVNRVDARTVEFQLPEPFAPFLENTTLGILPKHIWSGLTPDEFPHSEFNVTPVGAGPYRFEKVTRDTSGIPVLYDMTAFEHYALGAPHIRTFSFKLCRNEAELLDAFAQKTIDAFHGVAPDKLSLIPADQGRVTTLRAPLYRIFGVFYNHNKAQVFLHDEVREALEIVTPKSTIVAQVLAGYGTVLNGPLPPLHTTASSSDEALATADQSGDVSNDPIARARAVLEEAGWERPEEGGVYILKKKDGEERLAFSLSTASTLELTRAAELVAAAWRMLGADVELKIFEPTDLTQNVIRPRRYDALLFGEVTGREKDLYAFWHSSQRNDPGLNIAQFADIEADTLLEKARTELNTEKQQELFNEIEKRITTARPGIFLYTPDFIYVTNGHTQNIKLSNITDPSDRLSSVHNWYVETDRVWPFVEQALR